MPLINSNNLLKLKQLIFGATSVVYLNTAKSEKEQVQEITDITNVFLIDGFALKQNIASDGTLIDFTDEDWKLILAQYRLTYSKNFTEQDEEILQKFMESTDEKESFENKREFLYTIEPESKIVNFIIDILQSKTVLRENQIEILEYTPIHILEKAYVNAKISIKETNILVLKYLISSGSKIELFTSLDDIVRFLVSTYGYTSIGIIPTKLNKKILSQVELKIPTSIRKIILKSIDAIIAKHKFNETVKQQVKKYQQFWKRIFKQLAYTSQTKMEKRFANAFKLNEMLYPLRLTHENGTKIANKRIATNNTDIEYFRSIGDLGTALTLELDNPGQMIRRIFSYIRYSKGSTYAKKDSSKSKALTEVIDDVSDVINSQMFDNALKNVNLKLLWQLKEMIPQSLENTFSKIVNRNTVVNYKEYLPGLNLKMANLLSNKISSIILDKQLKANEKFGKVYFDKSLNTMIPMQFTGRNDVSTSMSGGYYPSGSTIDLKQLINNYLEKNTDLTEEDIIVRAGIAWKGKSCDIDLSTKFIKKDPEFLYDLYFGRPNAVNEKNEIIGVSSGDITYCNLDKFSTEFIDFKYSEMKQNFNYAISIINIYGGARSFNNIECYYFFDIVSKIEAHEYGTKKQFELNLFDQTFAIKIGSSKEDSSNAFYGCHIDFDLDKIIVHAKNDNVPQKTSVVEFAKGIFDYVFKKQKTYINTALEKLFYDNQITTNIEEANIIFTTNQSYMAPDNFTGRVYNIATNEAECQKFYFGE